MLSSSQHSLIFVPPRKAALFVLMISVLFSPLCFTQACNASTESGTIDEREFLREDYVTLEKRPEDIVRPYRRQRTLCTACKTA